MWFLLMIFFNLANQSVRPQTLQLFNPRPLPPVVTEDALLPLPGVPVVSVPDGDYLFVACTNPDTVSCVQTRFGGLDRPPVLLNTRALDFEATNIVVSSLGPLRLLEVYGGADNVANFSATPALSARPAIAPTGPLTYEAPLTATAGENQLTLNPTTRTVRTLNALTGKATIVQLEGAAPGGLFLGRGRAFVVDKISGLITSIDATTGKKTDQVPLRTTEHVQAVFQEHRVLALAAAAKALVPLFVNDARVATPSIYEPAAYTEQIRNAPQTVQVGKVRLTANDPAALDTAVRRVKTDLFGNVREQRELPGLRRSIYDFQPVVEYTPRGLRLDRDTEIHFDVAATQGVLVALHPVKGRRA